MGIAMKFGYGCYSNSNRACHEAFKKFREIDILLDSMSSNNIEKKIREIRRIIGR